MTAWVKFGLAVVAFLRELMAAIGFAQAKQAGRDETNASTQKQNAERAAEARKVEEQAERDHRFNPDDDSGLDRTFRRD